MPISRSRSPAKSPLANDAPPIDSIVALTQALVRAPSRAGRDRYDDVVTVMSSWLEAHGLRCDRIAEADGRVVALTAAVGRSTTSKRYLLDATLDTAPFGDRRRWAAPPASGVIRDGWLYGRGAADSKAGAALFAHLAASFAHAKIGGAVALLFDLDEHSGAFSGIKRFMESHAEGTPAGAFIGYPGNDRIVVGGRGFVRARIRVHGVAAHSGSHTYPGVNAVTRAARLALEIEKLAPAADAPPEFPLPPKISVTGAHGGEGFSVVPDVCTLDIDVRTTPRFTADDARGMLERIVKSTLPDEHGVASTDIEWLADSWPPYRVGDDVPIVQALRTSAREAFGREIPTVVAGPSNIGNYLAQRGVPAIAGFGVTARNIHASDECVEIASFAPVWTAYRDALAKLMR